jgi:hypothetical protein
MISDQNSPGSAVLRLAGCPIKLWLAAANEQMFASVRQWEELQEKYACLLGRLADRIGSEIVPHRALTRKERALAINLRRQMRKTNSVRASAYRQLAELVRQPAIRADALASDVEIAERLAAAVATLEEEILRTLDQEEARLALSAFKLTANTPQMGALLRHHNSDLFMKVEALEHSGRGCNRSVRRNGDYLWKIIDRATTKSTPRDWHSHVALLPISSISAMSVPVVSQEVATVWCENVLARRRTLLGQQTSDRSPNVYVSLNPLNWQSDEHLIFWVPDSDRTMPTAELELRRTALVEVVCGALAAGPMLLTDFRAAVLPRLPSDEHGLLPEFTEHLVSIGVLQVDAAPRTRTESWHLPFAPGSIGASQGPCHAALDASPASTATSSPTNHPVAGNSKSAGYLDVYRRTTELSNSCCVRIQWLITQARRLLAVMDAERSAATANDLIFSENRPEPLLEVLKETLRKSGPRGGHRRHGPHWPRPVSSDSPYSRLLDFIASTAADSPVIDLSSDFFDDLGAPDGKIDWPIDCVVRLPRPGADFEAVLDEVFPAGSLDARFVTSMQTMYQAVPHADAYQQFLRLLENETGIRFLELLIPPLSLGAANAVRRPIYTRVYTGDPSVVTYLPGDDRLLQYIPLRNITLRRVRGRLHAEADGRQVCPTYHATRHPLPPWNTLADILLSTGPLPMRWSARRLHHSLDAFPGSQFMPRITVAGGLVVSPAQWRISEHEIWELGATPVTKVRSLEQLRRRLRLPRWVFASDRSGGKPIPCDLESVRSIGIIEDAATSGSREMLMVEMVPNPEQLLVKERLNGSDEYVASEIMLRLPCDRSPMSLASELARAFH